MTSSRFDLFERIRRDRRNDPRVSVRALAARYRVHRRTVREALESAAPKPRKKPLLKRRSVLAPAYGWIDAMLREDLVAPRKQRHTIPRIRERLATEYGFTLGSKTTVHDYVARRRPEIAAEAREGHVPVEAVVPQRHEPGLEGEVDFADVWVRIGGELLKCHQFTLRLSYSAKAVHRVFLSEAQEAFLEGHVESFRVLGGVPLRHIRYDNLKPAVKRVCFGRNRVESERWVAFRSHYGFDAFYCMPGQDGAHEKGGVEQEGGRFRRTHLVPVPEVGSLDELNARIAEIDRAEDERVLFGHNTSVGFRFREEAGLLRPLPAEEFDCGLTLTPKVWRDSRITVRQARYSVPARFIGRRVRVSLRANEVVVFDRRNIIARHVRLTRRQDTHDVLDHYLEILLRKPGALRGSTALATARAEGGFTATHDAFWDAARRGHGEADGTRALIEVLLLHRHRPADAVIKGITAALEAGSTSPELVAIEARKADTEQQDTTDLLDATDLAELGLSNTGDEPPPPGVLSLPTGREVPTDQRPLPSVAIYDQLLHHRKDTPA